MRWRKGVMKISLKPGKTPSQRFLIDPRKCKSCIKKNAAVAREDQPARSGLVHRCITYRSPSACPKLLTTGFVR